MKPVRLTITYDNETEEAYTDNFALAVQVPTRLNADASYSIAAKGDEFACAALAAALECLMVALRAKAQGEVVKVMHQCDFN